MTPLTLQFGRMDEAIQIMREVSAWARGQGLPVWKDEWLTKEALLSDEVQPENFCVGKWDGESACAFLLQWRDTAYWPGAAEGEAAYLHKFCVRRKFAHRNMTQHVIAALRPICREKGIRFLRLDAGTDEITVGGIYRRAGFRIVEILRHPNGRSTALYELKL